MTRSERIGHRAVCAAVVIVLAMMACGVLR